MTASPDLSLVIPAYREEARIASTLQKLHAYMKERTWIHEVILVIEPSSDQTTEIARTAAQDFPKLVVVENTNHRGKGFAVKTGILRAKGQWVLYSDADLAVSLDHIDSLFAAAQKSHDPANSVWIGNRYANSTPKPVFGSRLRTWASRFFRKTVIRLVGLSVADSQCGFKLLQTKTAASLFSRMKIDGFAFDLELLNLARKGQLSIHEWPVTFRNSVNSSVSVFKHGLQVFKDLFRINHRPLYLITFTILAGLGVAQTWVSLDVMSVDHEGHITSAWFFWKGYFHGFVDQAFMGYVQNLFYPPLQDFILGAFLKVFPLPAETAYKIYLTILWPLFIAAALSLHVIFSSLRTKAWFFAGAAALILNAHNYLVDDQGLGIRDLLVFGLSSQLLSGIFFFSCLRILMPLVLPESTPLSRDTWRYLTLFTTLCLLSHLVSSLVLFGVFAVIFISRPQHRLSLLKAGIVATSLSFFFWGPFLIYRSELITGSVFNTPRFGPALFLPLLLIFYRAARRRENSALMVRAKACLPFGLLIFIFAIPTLIEPVRRLMDWQFEFPAFHYYRLSQYANWIQLLLSCLVIEALAPFKFPKLKLSTSLGFLSLVTCFLLGKHVNPTYFFKWERPAALNHEALPMFVENLRGHTGRTWIKHIDRPVSFSLDSILIRDFPELRAVKGLFWESSINNELLSSYLMSLEGEPHVLAGTKYHDMSYLEYACIQRSFIEDFAIQGIMAPAPIALSNNYRQQVPLPENINLTNFATAIIENRMLARELDLDYTAEPIVNLGLANYRWFNIHPKFPHRLDLVENLNAVKTVTAIPRNSKTRTTALRAVLKDRCQEHSVGRSALVADVPGGFFSKDTTSPSRAYLKKISRGVFSLARAEKNEKEAPYLVKMTFTPFWKLTSEENPTQALPIYRSWPGMVIKLGEGNYRLEFQRPWALIACYLVSGAAWLSVLVTLNGARRRRRQHVVTASG